MTKQTKNFRDRIRLRLRNRAGRRAGGLRFMAAVLTLLAAAPSSAGSERDPDPFDRPGLYVGFGPSFQYNVFADEIEDAIRDELTSGDVAIGSLDLDESFGLNATVGYRLASFFAFELEYEWIDQYDVAASGSFDVPPVLNASGTLYRIEGHTLTANTRWILPIWRIQPYVLLGGGFAVSDVDRGGLYESFEPLLLAEGIDIDEGESLTAAGRFGLGFDWSFTRHLVLNTEVGIVVTTLEAPDVDDIEDLNYLSFQAGLQYRF